MGKHFDVHLRGGTVIRVIADGIDTSYDINGTLYVGFINAAKLVHLTAGHISAVIEV